MAARRPIGGNLAAVWGVVEHRRVRDTRVCTRTPAWPQATRVLEHDPLDQTVAVTTSGEMPRTLVAVDANASAVSSPDGNWLR